MARTCCNPRKSESFPYWIRSLIKEDQDTAVGLGAYVEKLGDLELTLASENKAPSVIYVYIRMSEKDV